MATGQAPSFAALLRRYRRAAGLTQEALAEQAHLSVYTVSALERGANQTPRKDTVALLVDALGLAPRERAALEAAARGRGSTTAAPLPAAARTSTPLVGRAQDLALLERHLAAEGSAPVLLLAGEPGIGKSRLLHEAAQRGAGAGWTVLTGGCQRGGGQDPYAPLPAALEGRLRHRPVAQARAELAGCAWLARLLPEVAELGAEALPSWTLRPEQERRLVVRALERYLRNVAGPAGTLLLLDDVQWAGPDGLEVLAALVQTAEDIPLRVLAAYRSTEAPPDAPLSALLADLLSAQRATQHELAPLAAEEAAALLDHLLAERPVAEAERAQVLQRAAGLPFFLLSCVEGLAAGGSAAQVPVTVAQSIRQRVAALPPAAQEVLRAAAVVGRVAERAVLLAMAGQPRAEVLAALEATCGAHLLEEEGSAAYRFAHDLVREVVEGDLSAARRAALHQQVGEALEALPGPPAVELLAYHYARSDAADKARRYLEQAGDHATARGANAAAEGCYRDLGQRLEALGRRQDAAAVYAKLGHLLTATTRSADYIKVLELAIGTLRQDGPSNQRPATSAVAALDAESLAILTRIESCKRASARGDLYLAQANLLLIRDRLPPCLLVTERALELARRQGDDVLLARTLTVRGDAFLKLGSTVQALDALQDAVRLSEACGDRWLLGIALCNAAWAYLICADYDQARQCIARWLTIAEEGEEASTTALALCMRAYSAFYTGDWEQAEQDLALAVRTAPHIAHDPLILCYRATLLMGRGDWFAAAACLAEAMEATARLDDRMLGVWAERLQAELDLLEGRPDAARTRLLTLCGREQVHDVADMLPYLALAHLQLGEIEQAEAVSAQAVERVTAEQNRRGLADALWARAQVLLEQQRWAEAEQVLTEGLRFTRATGRPFAEARLLHLCGQTRISRGEGEAARERLEEALAIFRRLGAHKDVERVAQTIAALAPSA